MEGKRRVYYLYLSTLISSGIYSCDKSDLANVKWNIDWSRIFPTDLRDKDCIVRIKLQSKEVAEATLVYNNNIGTIRASFSSVYQNSNNGVILSLLNVIDSPSSLLHIISADTTTNADGVRIKVPTGNSYFAITLFDMSETSLLTANLTDYQIEFYFEIIE